METGVGGMGRTMLGWSRPWSTRISLHTLSSFPLTFFFGIALSATSRVTSPGAVVVEGLRVAVAESGVVGREMGEAVVGGVVEPAARRSARVHCSGGTCHVARCHG